MNVPEEEEKMPAQNLPQQRLREKIDCNFDKDLSSISEVDNAEKNEKDSWHLVSRRAERRPSLA